LEQPADDLNASTSSATSSALAGATSSPTAAARAAVVDRIGRRRESAGNAVGDEKMRTAGPVLKRGVNDAAFTGWLRYTSLEAVRRNWLYTLPGDLHCKGRVRASSIGARGVCAALDEVRADRTAARRERIELASGSQNVTDVSGKRP
jgi:hypothetical protein